MSFAVLQHVSATGFYHGAGCWNDLHLVEKLRRSEHPMSVTHWPAISEGGWESSWGLELLVEDSSSTVDSNICLLSRRRSREVPGEGGESSVEDDIA